MTYFHGDEAKQFSIFYEKKNQNGRLKKLSFQQPTKAEQLSPKFHKLVIGLVGIIDAKGINEISQGDTMLPFFTIA